MRQYEDYRNSNTVSFGQTNSDWESLRLRYLVKINPSKSEIKSGMRLDELVPFLPMEKINKDGHVDYSEKKTLHEVINGFTYFRKGDVVLAKITPCFENGKGAYLSDLNSEFGFGTTELIVLRPNFGIDGKFIYYVTRSGRFRREGADSMTGSAGQQRVPTDFVKNYITAVPPIEEQKAIVHYLDEKLEHIEQLVEKKHRLIEVLEEQKKTVAEQTATRGLKSEVSTKDSGLKWLGCVPKHWQVKRARYYFREVDERSDTGEEELLSVSHITGVTPRSEKTITMFKAESYEGSKTCKPNDLVINIMWAWMGAMGVSAYTGIVSSAYGVYRPKSAQLFDAEYLDYLTRTSPYIAEYNARSRGITSSRARMYTEDFYDIPIVRPPLSEQKEIVAYIKNETQTIDKAIQKSRSEISLIEEYRTTLISEAVTGKIDVRNATQ